jgi:hypothetical protein
MAVIFSVDLSISYQIELNFTPSNSVSRNYDVYEFYTGPHVKSWWEDWGGNNDIPVSNRVEIFIGGQFLFPVNSLNDCCLTPWSIYDEPTAGMVYINTPIHTWLYDPSESHLRTVGYYSSGPKSDNPSDDIYNNEHWPIRLETPKLSVKLSDVINGLVKYSSFDFTLFNDDGIFDNAEVTNYFNSPAFIRKSWVENPSVNDFIPIRYGIIESIKIDDKTMQFSCGDKFRTLDEPVSITVGDKFPDAVENKDDNLPVVYGTVKLKPIKIDTNKYVAGENIIGVSSVFDKDGNSVGFSFSSGVITTSQEIDSVIVTGNTNNRLGDVIVDIISSKTRITYIDSFWDLNETNAYRLSSPTINIVFDGITVRNAVKNALASDSVFLIQKNDGRFTLRKWGNDYGIHSISKEMITKFPKKDFSDAQSNYFSSCSIDYNYDFYEKECKNTFLFTDNEKSAIKNYSKKVRKTFETCLIYSNDCLKLARQLSNRFSTLREQVQVAVGQDTSRINLLDTVYLPLVINDRHFSVIPGVTPPIDRNTWIVKEIDPAQDILVLEAK